MSKAKKKVAFEDYLGCFGDFYIGDEVCKNLCSLNILCAIERDHNDQMEILEELVEYESMHVTLQ